MENATNHGTGSIIAIMTKAPNPGSVKTRLLSALTPDAAAQLHAAFLQDTLALIQGVSTAHAAVVCPAADADALRARVPPAVSVVPQGGAGLAAGMSFAFTHFARAGYDKMLLLDSDSPHLPRPYLEQALAALAEADLTLGPTDDGGYYLVGACRGYPDLFEASALSTCSALDTLIQRAATLRLRTSLLPSWFDVDLPEDLARLAAMLCRQPELAPHTAACLQRLGLLGRNSS